MFLCPEEEGTVRGAPHHGVVSGDITNYATNTQTVPSETPGNGSRVLVRIRLQRAEPPRQATRRAQGRPSTEREKHPPTTLESFLCGGPSSSTACERGDQGSQSLFRRGRAGMTTPRVLSKAAPNLRSTAWRHQKVASSPGAIGFGAAGPASHLFLGRNFCDLGSPAQ